MAKKEEGDAFFVPLVPSNQSISSASSLGSFFEVVFKFGSGRRDALRRPDRFRFDVGLGVGCAGAFDFVFQALDALLEFDEGFADGAAEFGQFAAEQQHAEH